MLGICGEVTNGRAFEPTMTPSVASVFGRYRLLITRMSIAKELGFRFIGTSYTRMPDRVRLFDKTIALSFPNDPALLNDVINIFLDDEYGLRTIGTPVQTVVDIGANIGLFSLWARHHFPGAMIHAYEPNEEICRYAAANFKDAEIALFHEAVSNASSSGSLVMNESSRLVKTRKGKGGSIKLTGINTVIERIGGGVDLLKMDCEGGEWDIFLESAAFKKVRQIRMEYHLDEPGQNMARLEGVASTLGFQVIKIVTHGSFGIAWLKNV
jgi:FkbM family methyltransferase